MAPKLIRYSFFSSVSIQIKFPGGKKEKLMIIIISRLIRLFINCNWYVTLNYFKNTTSFLPEVALQPFFQNDL